MNIKKTLGPFFESEKSTGIILIACTVFSLVFTNSSAGGAYTHFFANFELIINDGLMAIFFLLIGLELKYELYKGELASRQKAMLPLFAALGGMIFPATLFLFFNYGTSTQSGIGIPIATDIVFAIGVLSLLGKRVPPTLKIFLTAFAVIDDLGAIVVIALFYSTGIAWTNLMIALFVLLLLFTLNKAKIHNLIFYIIGGIVLWYFMLHSGIHASLAGILLASVIPFEKENGKSPAKILEHILQKPVKNIVLPVFALANTCVFISHSSIGSLTDTNGLGILCGLIFGKPLGIALFSFIAVYFDLCALPKGVNWKHITGVGILGGIGFTMSIFISQLAYEGNAGMINNSKLTVLIASCVAGIIGLCWLSVNTREQRIKKI